MRVTYQFVGARRRPNITFIKPDFIPRRGDGVLFEVDGAEEEFTVSHVYQYFEEDESPQVIVVLR